MIIVTTKIMNKKIKCTIMQKIKKINLQKKKNNTNMKIFQMSCEKMNKNKNHNNIKQINKFNKMKK